MTLLFSLWLKTFSGVYYQRCLTKEKFLLYLRPMETSLLKREEVKRDWVLIDASGQVLGRLASKVARVLMGKHKPTYTPHIDSGDFVVVLNASKIRVTGKKLKDKIYYHHSGYPGGLKEIRLEELLKRHPERVIYLAVKRMLPKNKLQAKRLRRLKIYSDSKHPHQAQRPIPLAL